MVKLSEKLYWYENEAISKAKAQRVPPANILNDWKKGVWTHNVPKTDEDILENIRTLKPIKILVPRWAMDRFKEALDQYVHGMWVSSLILSTIIAEYYVWWLIEHHVVNKGLSDIVDPDVLKRQQVRIALVKKLGLISDQKKNNLMRINDSRNNYIHLKTIDDTKLAKKDAKIVISNLTNVLNVEKETKTFLKGAKIN